MWLTARNTFRRTDPAWQTYASWMKLEHLGEVRTIDAMLNDLIDRDHGVALVGEDWQDALPLFPELDPQTQYYQLAVDLSTDLRPKESSRLRLLGYDLCDDTWTSSLLNCGPWEGILSGLDQRRNAFGLLDLDAATEAQRLLPEAWGENEIHAFVDVWALFEVASA